MGDAWWDAGNKSRGTTRRLLLARTHGSDRVEKRMEEVWLP